jgi:hypothetical protein
MFPIAGFLQRFAIQLFEGLGSSQLFNSVDMPGAPKAIYLLANHVHVAELAKHTSDSI